MLLNLKQLQLKMLCLDSDALESIPFNADILPLPEFLEDPCIENHPSTSGETKQSPSPTTTHVNTVIFGSSNETSCLITASPSHPDTTASPTTTLVNTYTSNNSNWESSSITASSALSDATSLSCNASQVKHHPQKLHF